MTLLTLDFETYFDNEYSLSRMTTEEYVRDIRFETLVTGMKVDDKPAKGVKANGEIIEIPALPSCGVLAHHAHFDGLILSHHYGLRPAMWFDTLSMARCAFPHWKSHSLAALAEYFGLGAKSVPYEAFRGKHVKDLNSTALYNSLAAGCAHDCDLTYLIYKKLLPLVPKEELKVIDLTVRMFTDPVLKLDKPRVETYVRELIKKQEQLLTKLGVTKSDLHSADKFAGILESYGIDPPTKISPRTGKTAYAFAKTDQGFISLLNHEDETIQLLAEARVTTKSTLGESRGGRLLSMASRGSLPVYLKYYGAHTGRWSGGDKLNFQNLQRGGELRKSLLAPEGFVLVVLDLSQIECRVLNYLAREDWVLDAFREKRDLYSEMASDFYGRKITKEDKNERFVGKTLVLGAGYGVGWKKLQGILKLNKINLSEWEAKAAIEKYRKKHVNVVRLWQEAEQFLKYMYQKQEVKLNWGPMGVHPAVRGISLPNGAMLDYGTLDLEGKDFVLKNPKGTVKIYGGKLVENVVQALSRIILSQAMLKIAKAGYKIVLTCHDEIVYLALKDEADIAYEIGVNILKQAPDWCKNLPLEVEGGYDVRYSK